MEDTEKTYVVLPLADHTHTAIFLHGRDSTAVEFAEEFFESQASDERTLREIFPNFKWVFPNSGLRNSTRFDMDIAQWFDIWSVEDPEKRKDLQVTGLTESVTYILKVIREEASSVPTEHIILGGISQGCATAIHALMHCDIQLNGFIGFCGWLPFQEEIEAIARNTMTPSPLQEIRSLLKSASSGSCVPPYGLPYGKKNSALSTSVFLSHSIDDPIVPMSNGKKLYQELDHLGMTVIWKAYEDGGHWINEPQGVDDMVDFLRNTITVHN
jgi:lysophospholipase II